MHGTDNTTTEVFVADDEPGILEMLTLLLGTEGYRVRAFADGETLLAAAKAVVPSCILLDVRLPGRSGMDILKELNADQYPAPILMISGHGDIPTAVTALRSGALDFIEKPFDGKAVVAAVRNAIEGWARRSEGQPQLPSQFPGNEQLTARERDVLSQIANGASNKEAGRQLGISPRTIEVHRARIMEKVGAKNAADLVRLVLGHGSSARH